jgi:hypothetical protein
LILADFNTFNANEKANDKFGNSIPFEFKASYDAGLCIIDDGR